jgi:2-amino-4-hydroxy-6-hydroxymethyldihydropteridine diphosphokinase
MIILSIGTNIGDRERNIENAVKALGEIGKVTAISPIYTSEPWGFESENGFYNIALTMESELLPLDLLRETQRIEKELGRTAKTTTEYADRVIDIDIIDYDNQIIKISQQSSVISHQSSIEPPRPTDTPPKTGGEYLDQESTLNSQLSTLNKPQAIYRTKGPIYSAAICITLPV